MAPLKFRAWHPAEKKWITDVFVGHDGWHYTLSKDDHQPELILMQSTGLLDKNGKEIFEGDVLRDSSRPNRGFKAVVEWQSGEFVGVTVPYRNHAVSLRRIIVEKGMEYDEICGNIYENASLLSKT